MDLKNLESLLADEEKCCNKVHALRKNFCPVLPKYVDVTDKKHALERGMSIVHDVMNNFKYMGLDVSNIKPGHGAGHIARDYVNAAVLLHKLGVSPKDALIGFVGGVLHDIGCAVVERYRESQTTIRHAEAGAFLVAGALREIKASMNDAERIFITYSVAAHTHYLAPFDVKCADGVVRHVEPYMDMDRDGKPILGVWLPRWIDRLDCNGPTFIGRHYLTLVESRKDFDGKQFYDITFGEHMRPITRAGEEIRASGGKRTMLEHLKMFADSHNNDSVYGRHDFGRYVTLRDNYKERLFRIIESAKSDRTFTGEQEDKVVFAWNMYLAENIEPTKLTSGATEQLTGMFKTLDDKTRRAWCNVFLAAMKEYQSWSAGVLKGLCSLSGSELALPTVTDDVRKVIAPYHGWVDIVNEF